MHKHIKIFVNGPKGKILRKIFREWPCHLVGRLGNAKFHEKQIISNSQNSRKFCCTTNSHYTVNSSAFTSTIVN